MTLGLQKLLRLADWIQHQERDMMVSNEQLINSLISLGPITVQPCRPLTQALVWFGSGLLCVFKASERLS